MAGVLEALDAALDPPLLLVGQLASALWSLPTPVLLVLSFGVLFFVFGRSPSSQALDLDVLKPRQPSEAAHDDPTESFCRSLGAPDYPHDEACLVPPTELFFNNGDAYPFQTDLSDGFFLGLHRATFDKELDKSGNYPFGSYFKGKKRLWEVRFQFRFRRQPPSIKDLFVGIELNAYVPMNRATKRTMETLVGMLKQVVGKHVHHSPGDDPEVVKGPLERPVFAMPMWAFDQFIVTPEGQEAPKLTDPGIPQMGSRRFKRVKEYKREMDELDLRVGPTYTFCFWGISQWLDRVNWQVKMPLMSPIDFNKFCGSPPVHLVLYTLRNTPGEEHERRHLQHRKQYVFDLCFWSSKCRPSLERIQDLLRTSREEEDSPTANTGRGGGGGRRRGSKQSGAGQWLGCCAARG